MVKISGFSVLMFDDQVFTAQGALYCSELLIDVARPWSQRLLYKCKAGSKSTLDLVRGSDLLFEQPCELAYLLEAPTERSILCALSWEGNALVGTEKVRQDLNVPVASSLENQAYRLNTRPLQGSLTHSPAPPSLASA